MNSKYTWSLKTMPDATVIQKLHQQTNLPSTICQLLWQRKLQNPEQIDAFLHPDLTNLYDPDQLHDMSKAVTRIQRAIVDGEQIVVYGDYDVDGLTSTTIMKETLETLGAEVDYYTPNRFTDGYGPNIDVYKRLIAQGTQLIITVDNGVAGNAAVNFAQEQGVDVIITDHHELPKILPKAFAIVHPRHPEGHYPFGELSGAGVAFKVATALLEEVPTDMLDLAALGTVADLVSLTDENRIIVAYGLKALRQTQRPGLSALYKVAGIEPSTITETSIGFGIGPRLNALGRMGDARVGVTLLSTLDETKATALAKQIQQTNVLRQGKVEEITQAAMKMAESPDNQAKRTLVLAAPNWHEGVLGIVASHVVAQTGKPTLVMNIDPKTQLAKGSGRSVEAFHLFKSLEPSAILMKNFGGHHMAVGLTVPMDHLQQVHQNMEAFAKTINFQVTPQPSRQADLKLSLEQCNLDFYHAWEQLAPFGTDNEQPIFEISNVKAAVPQLIGKQKNHLKFILRSGQNQLVSLAFGCGDWYDELQGSQSKVTVFGTLNLNHFKQQTTLQLLVEDLQISQSQAPHAKLLPQIKVHKLEHLSPALFQNAGLYVFFKKIHLEKTVQLLPALQDQSSLFSDNRVSQEKKLTIVDQPATAQQLDFLLTQQSAQELLFTFYDTQRQFEFPSRQIFSQVLHYLRQHHDLALNGSHLVAKYLQINTDQLRFILKVFSELSFVKINNGMINAASNVKNQSLSASPLFTKVQQQFQIHQQIAEKSNIQLQQWLQNSLKKIEINEAEKNDH